MKLGYFTSYRHAFGFDQFRAAIAQQPVIVGALWTRQMFTPDKDGVVHVGALTQDNIAGGHEYLARGIDYDHRRVLFRNSWGSSWGTANPRQHPRRVLAELRRLPISARTAGRRHRPGGCGMSEALSFIAGVCHANACAVSANHTPRPLRYVFHHIQPQCCGGPSTAKNRVALCDSCHYAVHLILHELKVAGTVSRNRQYNAARIALARQGYELCVAAGTVAQIPNEGGGFAA